MPIADPWKFPLRGMKFMGFDELFARNRKQPHIGVTQGGSSRENSGAVPAATDGLVGSKRRKKND